MDKDMDKKTVYIVDGSRTPFLKFTGVPGPFSASDLSVQALKALFLKLNLSPAQIDNWIMGCVMPSETEANIARLIALRAGAGVQAPAFSVQRNCASGLQAIDSGAQNIALGISDLIIAGGCEAMSRAPLLYSQAMSFYLGHISKAKTPLANLKAILAFKLSHLKPTVALLKELNDPFINLNMGQTAQELAFKFDITRSQMDAYALQSHILAAKADFSSYLTPIYANNGQSFETDTGVRADSSLEKIASLRPVFDAFGDITPANSSQISDGAAVLLLGSEKAVDTHKLPILGKIIDTHWSGVEPAHMGLGPIHAMQSILTRQNLQLKDIDLIEINEAFAAKYWPVKKPGQIKIMNCLLKICPWKN